MNQGMKSRQKFELRMMYGLVFATIAIFIVAPAYADSKFYMFLNNFFDNYLFGNGYYKPTAYPFAAKVTNSLSVVLTVIVGILVGYVRRYDVLFVPKRILLYIIIIWFATLYMFWTSVYPQHFSINPPKRSFGLTESFHNNPFLFIMLMIIKNTMIYIGMRLSTTFILFYFQRKKNKSKS